MKEQAIPERGVGFVRLAWRVSMVLAVLIAVSPVLASGLGKHVDGGWAFVFAGGSLLCAAALRRGNQPRTAKIGLIALIFGLSVSWLQHVFVPVPARSLPAMSAPDSEARFVGNQKPEARHVYFSGSASSTSTKEGAK